MRRSVRFRPVAFARHRSRRAVRSDCVLLVAEYSSRKSSSSRRNVRADTPSSGSVRRVRCRVRPLTERNPVLPVGHPFGERRSFPDRGGEGPRRHSRGRRRAGVVRRRSAWLSPQGVCGERLSHWYVRSGRILPTLQSAAGGTFIRSIGDLSFGRNKTLLYDGEAGIPFGDRLHAVPIRWLWETP